MHFNRKYKLELKIFKTCGKSLHRFGLIKPNETILIGLSGGKDSLTLTDMLVKKRKQLPFEFELKPVFVKMRGFNDTVNTGPLENFCRERSLTLHIIETEVTIENDKDPCFVCSWHRRKTLFKTAQSLGIQKIALGHNLDDAAETLLMNMCFSGNISTMPPEMSLFDGDLSIIRPLTEVPEKMIEEYANQQSFPIQHGGCILAKEQSRSDIKDILSQLEKRFPRVKENLFASMMNIREEYLPRERPQEK